MPKYVLSYENPAQNYAWLIDTKNLKVKQIPLCELGGVRKMMELVDMNVDVHDYNTAIINTQKAIIDLLMNPPTDWGRDDVLARVATFEQQIAEFKKAADAK